MFVLQATVLKTSEFPKKEMDDALRYSFPADRGLLNFKSSKIRDDGLLEINLGLNFKLTPQNYKTFRNAIFGDMHNVESTLNIHLDNSDYQVKWANPKKPSEERKFSGVSDDYATVKVVLEIIKKPKQPEVPADTSGKKKFFGE